MKGSWVQHQIKEVLREVEDGRILLKRIALRQRNWTDHILRGRSLLDDVVEGTYERERPQGRKRNSVLDDLKAGKSYFG